MVISIITKNLVTSNLARPRRILHGRNVTKPNGRNSNLAQSSCAALDGPSPVTQPFNSESRPFNSESRPFNSESRPFNSESRPFNSESRPFCGQLFFTIDILLSFSFGPWPFCRAFCTGLGVFMSNYLLGLGLFAFNSFWALAILHSISFVGLLLFQGLVYKYFKQN
jgi:hypothetical protein